MGNLNKLNDLLKIHLEVKNLYPEERLWRVQESCIEGRGIFANRDIKPGEIIFTDYPILSGPRAWKNPVIHCAVCFRVNNIYACRKGCGLPICCACEQSSEHKIDCELIKSLYNNGSKLQEICPELFRGLTPLRSLLIDGNSRELIGCLARHSGKIHGFEVDLLKKYLNLSEENESLIRLVCSVLDSNAFACVIPTDNSQVTIRGLYALSSLLNHCCTPNTTHIFDKNQRMIVKASIFIPKDTEILATYSSLLWGTTLRRNNLYVTKHFWCRCDRCTDPKEFGACLNGLKCIYDNCSGVIYPFDPLNNSSKWKCDACEQLVDTKKVGVMQSALGGLLKSVCLDDFEQLVALITERLKKVVPFNNHIAYELKLKAIYALGYNERYLWDSLTIEQLNFKEEICKDVLEILLKLQLGICKMRGHLLFELYRTRLERCKKISKDFKTLKQIKEENSALLKEAFEILENDVTAPPELTIYQQ